MRSRSAIEDVDVAAATFVVGTDLIECDFLSLSEAIANLPTAGGTIYVLEGTYAIPASISLPDKPIKFIGSGRGATVLSIAGIVGGAVLFSIAFDHPYTFRGFTIQGALGQPHQGWSGGVALTVAPLIDDVNSINLQFVVAVGPVGTKWRFTNCDFPRPDVIAAGTQSRFYQGNVGELEIVNVTALATTVVNDPGGMSNGPTVRAVDCRLSGSLFLGDDSTFTACDLFDVAAGGTNGPGARNRFIGCKFRNTGAAPARWIDANANATDMYVSGCDFGTATSEAILLDGATGCRITDNRNCKVREIAPANSNTYDNNDGFAGSIVIGASSRVDGMLRADSSGTTTAAFVTKFTHANPKGLVGVGTVKNTGGVNTMTVRETVTDAFGVTDSVSTDILPGNFLILNPQAAISTARPPYVSYAVAVIDKVAASHTTFELHHADQGAVL